MKISSTEIKDLEKAIADADTEAELNDCQDRLGKAGPEHWEDDRLVYLLGLDIENHRNALRMVEQR